MDAELIKFDRVPVGEHSFAELTIWLLPRMLPGSAHQFKYRLAFVIDDVCVLRYDNESGKGDHRHIGDREEPYQFMNIDKLLADFWNDIDNWES